jgi:predicted TIM-barrel fold metal-dependent hydrolase
MEGGRMKIQVHIHPWTEEFLGLFPRYLLDRYERSYAGFTTPRQVEDLIKDMDEIGMDMSVLLPIDCSVALGRKMSNDWVAEQVKKFPDRLIGFASVDPRMGKAAIIELERAIKQLDLKGLKLHPCIQEFYPHEKAYYPLYEKCVELDIPVTYHCGFGFGMKHIYGDPIYVDSVAFDFPDLRIDIAHVAWPWHEQCFMTCLARDNVYFDINAWRPKFLPQRVIDYTNSVLTHKVLFSTMFPEVDSKIIVEQWTSLVKPEVLKKSWEDNPKRFLKL